MAYILTQSGAGESASEDAAAEEDTETSDEVVSGDAANGETLFAGACAACHDEEDGVGPALVGMGERAATRVEGMTAEEYLHESIVDPGAHIVEGFTANIMPPTYSEQFSEQELQDIMAYVLSQ